MSNLNLIALSQLRLDQLSGYLLSLASGDIAALSAGYSGALSDRIDDVSGVLYNQLYDASGALNTKIDDTSGVLYTQLTGISGAIHTEITGYVHDVSGVLYAQLTDVSGAIHTEITGYVDGASGALSGSLASIVRFSGDSSLIPSGSWSGASHTWSAALLTPPLWVNATIRNSGATGPNAEFVGVNITDIDELGVDYNLSRQVLDNGHYIHFIFGL